MTRALLAVFLLSAAERASGEEDERARGEYVFRAAGGCTCHTAEGGAPLAGGRPLRTPFGTVPDETLYSQPVWVPVVHHHGDRGRLLVPLGKRGRLVSADLRKVQLQWRKVRVVVDLSAERMVVRDGRERLGAFPVGNGAASTPTPTGRFFVTDRLEFGQGSPYAPFAFGLSAHVSQLPASWLGGDQVAIHYGAMGAVSHGCIHAGLDAIELLKRRAALGTLVIVKA